MRYVVLTILITAGSVSAYYEYAGKWGSYGTGPGEFQSPHGIAVKRDVDRGNVYVADTGNLRIQYFGSTGSYIDYWYAHNLNEPLGLDFAWWTGQQLSVATGGFWHPEVQKYTPTGSLLNYWEEHPLDVAVAYSGYIYIVADYHVKYYTGSGSFVGSWGGAGSGNGKFQTPWGIAAAPNNRIYVADTYNDRIQYFTSTGSFLGKWGSEGSGEGQFNGPTGITVGNDFRVYVADRLNDRIQQFTGTGSFLQAWGSRGTGNGQFMSPEDVAVTKDGDYCYVCDGLDRIQYFYDNPGDIDGTFKTGTNVVPSSLGKIKVLFK